jgi:hypothetical protein
MCHAKRKSSPVFCAYAVAVTEGISFLLTFFLSGTITKQRVRLNLPAAGKIVIAAVLITTTILTFRAFNNILLTLTATCVYIVALYVTEMLGKTDIDLLRQIVHPRGDQK